MLTVVQFTRLDDFVAELREVSTCIADKTVRWQSGRTPINSDAIEFEVAVWATAIARLTDGEYLLEYGEAIGFDRDAAEERTTAASDDAEKLKRNLRDVCDDLGLKFRPGKLEPY